MHVMSDIQINDRTAVPNYLAHEMRILRESPLSVSTDPYDTSARGYAGVSPVSLQRIVT